MTVNNATDATSDLESHCVFACFGIIQLKGTAGVRSFGYYPVVNYHQWSFHLEVCQRVVGGPIVVNVKR